MNTTEHSIWTYIASGSNKIIEQRSEIMKSVDQYEEHYRIEEGINLLLLLGIATSIEGFLRELLVE